MDNYRKANREDEGRCTECLRRAYKLAFEIGDFKNAEGIGRDMLASAATPQSKAEAHYRIALALQRHGLDDKKHKDQCFNESCDELKAALDALPDFASGHYSRGVSLALLHQDDAARSEFKSYIDSDKTDSPMHGRAERFMGNIDLARARMVPPFSVTALDGQRISMDGLAGKVVLIDFWATWCGPCREALPNVRNIARRFAGQPLMVLSVSLDNDVAKWKEFVAKNGMTWLQYRDGGFDGPMAKQFGVTAIPATFTIDADGALEDQHVGDADIEGKIKKLVAHATELAAHKPAVSPAQPGAGTE
jgi:thiol-disulfide isomerase/thioredoxin